MYQQYNRRSMKEHQTSTYSVHGEPKHFLINYVGWLIRLTCTQADGVSQRSHTMLAKIWTGPYVSMLENPETGAIIVNLVPKS